MMNMHLTRREMLATGAAAALPLLGTTSAGAGAEAAAVQPVVGISTLGFHDYTNAELAEELAANRVHTVQLFLMQKDSHYWVYNGRNDVSSLDAARCRDIADAYRSRGISIHSIGVYTNLIHPDEQERNENLRYFEAMFRVGAAMDVRTFVTEAGHYEPKEHDGGMTYYLRENVWHQMVATGKTLADLADAHDATVLLEPFHNGFLASAKRTRLFIEAIDSRRIRALLDPANLIELNDLPEMFAQLSPYIDCLHAKDRKLHVERGVAAGMGDLNYDEFVALAAKYTPHAPFILEYVGAADYKAALELLQDAIRRHQSGAV